MKAGRERETEKDREKEREGAKESFRETTSMLSIVVQTEMLTGGGVEYGVVCSFKVLIDINIEGGALSQAICAFFSFLHQTRGGEGTLVATRTASTVLVVWLPRTNEKRDFFLLLLLQSTTGRPYKGRGHVGPAHITNMSMLAIALFFSTFYKNRNMNKTKKISTKLSTIPPSLVNYIRVDPYSFISFLSFIFIYIYMYTYIYTHKTMCLLEVVEEKAEVSRIQDFFLQRRHVQIPFVLLLLSFIVFSDSTSTGIQDSKTHARTHTRVPLP